MIYLDEHAVRRSLPWAGLADAIETTLNQGGIVSPHRSSYAIAREADASDGRLLIMPCWDAEASIGIKTVTYRPDNDRLGLPSHGASYILMDSRSGKVQAVLEAHELTVRRTAVVSALAARRLARMDATRMLIAGTGPVARAVAHAHAALRRLEHVEVFGRSPAKVAALVADLRQSGIPADPCHDLEAGARKAHIISMATSSTQPLLRATWLSPGAHVDLIGSFTTEMREVDDALLARADEIWVDTEAAIEESGDIAGPIAAGVIARDAVAGDLLRLVQISAHQRPRGAVTVFKAVGFAVCDLAAALLALRTHALALRKYEHVT